MFGSIFSPKILLITQFRFFVSVIECESATSLAKNLHAQQLFCLCDLKFFSECTILLIHARVKDWNLHMHMDLLRQRRLVVTETLLVGEKTHTTTCIGVLKVRLLSCRYFVYNKCILDMHSTSVQNCVSNIT
jgi:hypothetical protein